MEVTNGRVLALDGAWLTPVELLERVKARMREHPDQYDQNAGWIFDGQTQVCIGAMCSMEISTTALGLSIDIGRFLYGFEKGAWSWLFNVDFLPAYDLSGPREHVQVPAAREFSAAYKMARTDEERVAAGIRAIDYFIENFAFKPEEGGPNMNRNLAAISPLRGDGEDEDGDDDDGGDGDGDGDGDDE